MESSIRFDPQTLVDFLRVHGRGPNSKDHEIVFAVITAKFCEQQWKTDVVVGFELNEAISNYRKKIDLGNMDEIAAIIREKRSEATAVDFLIFRGGLESFSREGMGFQLKRFKGFGPDKATMDLVAFLQKQNVDYPQTPVTLLVILESEGEIDVGRVWQEVHKMTNKKFFRYMLVALTGPVVRFMELWPDSGTHDVSVSDLAPSKT